MKKFFKATFCILILALLSSMCVYAEDTDDHIFTIDELKNQYDILLDQSGAKGLQEAVPDDALGLLEDNGIIAGETDSLLNISFFDFLGNITDIVKDSATKPLAVFLTSIGVILLCALLNSLKTNFSGAAYERAFSVVSIVCISGTIIFPIAELISRSSAVLKQVSNFMLSFIPVYVGIISAASKPISAVTYQLSLVGVVQVISAIASSVLIPLMAIYLAFCLIGSTSSQINVQGIARGVKTTVTITLTFLLTIFVGLLSIQGVVASSADTLALKTGRFALSTFLPVVGSAISEALSSLQGCMGLMRATVGGFSIFVLISSFLPSIVTIILFQLAFFVCASVSDMLETDKISALLRSAASVLSILLAILTTFFTLLTVSIGIMLTIGN